MSNPTKFEIRKKLFERLPMIDENALPKFYSELIDESIDSVLDGSTTVEGKTASTIDDAVIFTIAGMKTRMDTWEQLKSELSSAFPTNVVTVTYRGTSIEVN
ncbi:MAG: hypothetical protein IM613_18960 [Cytophagales bacterium]|nr:hypothetical protein [Cytophagales bacterium]